MYNYSLKFKRNGYENQGYIKSETQYTGDEFKSFVKEAINNFSEEECKDLKLYDVFNKIIELHNDFNILDCCGFYELEMEI